MKGQTSIDFYIVLIIFIFFVIYFLFQISNLVPNFIQQMEEQRGKSEAYQVSELLVNDIGSPKDWDTLVPGQEDQIKRVGLSQQSVNRTIYLSLAKVTALNNICKNPNLGQTFVRNLINSDFQISVNITDRVTGGDPIVACDSPVQGFFVSTIKRVVAFDNGHYGELTVQVIQQ